MADDGRFEIILTLRLRAKSESAALADVLHRLRNEMAAGEDDAELAVKRTKIREVKARFFR